MQLQLPSSGTNQVSNFVPCPYTLCNLTKYQLQDFQVSNQQTMPDQVRIADWVARNTSKNKYRQVYIQLVYCKHVILYISCNIFVYMFTCTVAPHLSSYNIVSCPDPTLSRGIKGLVTFSRFLGLH